MTEVSILVAIIVAALAIASRHRVNKLKREIEIMKVRGAAVTGMPTVNSANWLSEWAKNGILRDITTEEERARGWYSFKFIPHRCDGRLEEKTTTVDCLSAHVKAGMIELELHEDRQSINKIIIDGKEITDVTKLVLEKDWQAGTLPTLTLTTLCREKAQAEEKKCKHVWQTFHHDGRTTRRCAGCGETHRTEGLWQ